MDLPTAFGRFLGLALFLGRQNRRGRWPPGAQSSLRQVITCLCLALFARSTASADAMPDYDVKAAYLLNFSRYVSWPSTAFADQKAPMVICVFGNQPFGSWLAKAFWGRVAGEHNLVVQRIHELGRLKACHLVFVGQEEEPVQAQLLDSLRDQHVLTVGESSHFLQDGGIIRLAMSDNIMRFEVNLTAASRAGLKISSRMLSLSANVQPSNVRRE